MNGRNSFFGSSHKTSATHFIYVGHNSGKGKGTHQFAPKGKGKGEGKGHNSGKEGRGGKGREGEGREGRREWKGR